MSELHPTPSTGGGEQHADVIFVHGLGGNAFTTWQYDRTKPDDCWPYWLADDRPHVAVHTLDYGASSSNWLGPAMPLYDRAREVLTRFQTLGVGRLPIVFVAHSLGGIVVKALLQQAHSRGEDEPAWAKILTATKAVIFVATPHVGADLARWADRLGPLLRTTPVLRGLRAHHGDLRNLQEWYSLRSRDLGIRTGAFYETAPTNVLPLVAPWLARVPGAFRLPTTVKVVEEGDANPNVNRVLPCPSDGDHFSVCKPRSRTDTICAFVRGVIDELLPAAPPPAGQQLPAPGLMTAPAGFAMDGETETGEKRNADSPYVKSLDMLVDARDFQERGTEQDKIIKALRAGVAVIWGMGGVGKTTLAVHVANTLKDEFVDGLRYLDLEGMSAQPLRPAKARAETARAMAQIIQSFDEKAKVPEDLDQASGLYRKVLQKKQVLLLLDNARDGAQVQPLVDPNSRGSATIIVTSRQSIITDGSPPIHLEELSSEGAQNFLFRRLGKDRSEGLKLRLLAERCGGLPLALKATADFLLKHRGYDAEQYINALDSGAIPMRLDNKAEKDVLAVLGLSIAQLARDNPQLSERWHTLLTFAADFDVTAVAAVWACKNDEAHRDLEDLVARSMLRYGRSFDYYGLHDLMRETANRQSAATDARPHEAPGLREAPASYGLQRSAEMRFAEYYCDFLEDANQRYSKGGDGLARYDREQRNIAAGQAWAAAHMGESDDIARLAADYPGVGVHMLNLRLHPHEWIKWLDAQLAACRKLGLRQGEGIALDHLGLAYADLGEFGRAAEYHEQALAIARDLEDKDGMGAVLCNLGKALHELGELQRAINCWERQLEVARETRNQQSEGKALGNLGSAYYDLGEPRQAIEYHQRSLAIARDQGDRESEANALGNLGNARRALGELTRAIEHYGQRLKITREIGDKRGEGNGLHNWALALEQLDEHAGALKKAEAALAIYEQIEDPHAADARALVEQLRKRA